LTRANSAPCQGPRPLRGGVATLDTGARRAILRLGGQGGVSMVTDLETPYNAAATP